MNEERGDSQPVEKLANKSPAKTTPRPPPPREKVLFFSLPSTYQHHLQLQRQRDATIDDDDDVLVIMSFYLDDYPDDDRQTSSQICPNCSGTEFYNDPVSGTLTCSSCYTQSQTATQEEFDYDDKIGLIAKAGARHRRGGPIIGANSGKHGGNIARPAIEYDRSTKLPDAKSCCLAFQWLLRDASKCVSKLAGIRENDSCIGISEYHDYLDGDGDGQPTILEKTVENIWFVYLQTWMESTREFSAVYPGMRVSFRDYFLHSKRKASVMRHLSVTVGKKIEEEILKEMQKKMEERSCQGDDDDVDDGSISSTEGGSSSSPDEPDHSRIDDAGDNSVTNRKRKKNRPQFIRVSQLAGSFRPYNPDKYPNGIYNIHPHHAVLKAQPSLTLILSILQLGLTHLQTGVAPHHLTMWAANGQLPQVLNGYSLLPTVLQNDVKMAKSFFMRSFVPPAAVVEDLAFMLAAATSWFDVSPPKNAPAYGYASNTISRPTDNLKHQTSLYNVPLLTARLIQDLGFDQSVLDISLKLMGVRPVSQRRAGTLKPCRTEASESIDQKIERNDAGHNSFTPSLQCTCIKKLYTPLHVAAVIIVACKLCPGWEMWKLTNFHSRDNKSNSGTGQQPSSASVPWNEAQLSLLGNGLTLDHYVSFLDSIALRSRQPSDEVAQFFQALERDMTTQLPVNDSMLSTSKTFIPQKKTKVLPNEILSGASNPNEPKPSLHSATSFSQYQIANNIGRYTFYQYRGKRKLRGIKPYHPHYCRLLEYVCYIIEETDPEKLHSVVEMFEGCCCSTSIKQA